MTGRHPHPLTHAPDNGSTLPFVAAQAALTQEAFIQELEDQIAFANSEGAKATTDYDRIKFERETYLMNLPRMTSRRDVQLYIASVAQGIGNGFIKIPDAKVLIYMAQLALAAFGTANANPPPPTPRLELNSRSHTK